MLDCEEEGGATEMKNTTKLKFQGGWGGPPGGVKKMFWRKIKK